jgi:hypothetical protein
MKRALLVLAVMLTGCVQADPPLLVLTGRSCDAVPVLNNAIPVPFASRSGAVATLGLHSPCLQANGGRAVTYAVFSLPEGVAPFLVTITSNLVGTAVVRPRATVYDANGLILRTIKAEDFRPTITGFTAGLRAQANDRLIMISADPASIGEPTTLRLGARNIGTQVAATAYVPIIITVPVQDQQRENRATLSLNGTIQVNADPIQVAR